MDIYNEAWVNYKKTFALWSFFCYFLGLQDRHCGNIMINIKNGKLLHIDLNAIFKGYGHVDQTHFRFTKNFERNLGVLKGSGEFKFFFIWIYRFFNKNKWEITKFCETQIPEEQLNETIQNINAESYDEVEDLVDKLIEFNGNIRTYINNFHGWQFDI